MEELVNLLIKENKTISTMESCTGGGIVDAITSIPNASKVVKFSAVTYSNEYKIKMGVSSKLIDEYTVYSEEVAKAMAKTISKFTGSSYGVGVTGKLKKADEENMHGDDDVVYLAIYENDSKNVYYCEKIKLQSDTRILCKKEIINKFVDKMLGIMKNSQNC